MTYIVHQPQVTGGDRTDGALFAGAGQRPDPSKGDHEVYEFPEPADYPEAFLRRARGALERSNPNSVQVGCCPTSYALNPIQV